MSFRASLCVSMFGAALGYLCANQSRVFAQSFNDALVQVPTLKAPSRGSVVGSLAGFAVGSNERTRGSLSLPASLEFPTDRGPLLADLVPSYAPEAGLSEWGMGWGTSLAISRHRWLGDLDYETDMFTGPWGPMTLGTDGHWYPLGFSSRILMERTNTGWVARDADGTRYEFTRTVTNSRGIYSWYLTRVVTVLGDETVLTYQTNSTGRPFVDQVTYGARGHVAEYRLSFAYEDLLVPFQSFHSGSSIHLDRRVRAVTVEAQGDVGYELRWTYDLKYTESPLSRVFYLEEVQRTWASGVVDPAVSYRYDLGTDTLQAASFEHIPALDDYLQVQAGSLSAIQPSHTSQLDLDRDGRVDLEHAYTQATVRHGPAGWTVEATPMAVDPHPLCRPAPSTLNPPRTLARLRPQDSEERVVHASFSLSANQTEFLVCDRPGAQLMSQPVDGNWVLGANTRLTDLNRDLRPDVVRVYAGQVTVLENTSSDADYVFTPRSPQSLTPSFVPQASWVHDMNGDGVVDLISRHSGGLTVWWGTGQLAFEPQGTTWPLYDRTGARIFNLDGLGVWFIDANNDGLMDLVLSHASGVWLFFNRGDHFEERPVPGLSELAIVKSNPVLADLRGSGDAQIVYAFVDPSSQKRVAHSLALNAPSTGLLTSANDGKGTRLTFSYDRSEVVQGVPVRPAVLAAITYDFGAVTQRYAFRYGDPVLHTESETLVGYRRIRQVHALFEVENWFYHDDDVRNLPIRSETREPSSGVSRFEARAYVARTHLGVSYRRLDSAETGWEDANGSKISETTKYLVYAREFCPVDIEIASRQGVLRWTTELAFPVRLDARHCLSKEVRVDGIHSDPSRDFSEIQVIERNPFGQVLKVQREGSLGRIDVQTITYDALQRVKTVFEPSGDGVLLTYDVDHGLLESIRSADGVVTEVGLRDPRTDAPLELVTHRGSVTHRQGFAFDGRERLASRWNSFNGTSATLPEETIDYGFPTPLKPGFILIKTLLDTDSSSTAETAQLINPDGQHLASLERIPQGWRLENLELHQLDARTTRRWARGPLVGPVEQVGFDALLSNGNPALLSSRQTSIFEHIVEERLRFPGDVSGSGGSALSLRGGDLVLESSFEGRIRNEGRDAGGRVIWREDATEARTVFAYDALGRIVSVELASGLKQDVRYDAYGRVDRVTRDGVGSRTYEYDEETNLLKRVKIRDQTDALARTVEHYYDAIGRKKTTAFGLTGTTRTKVYTYAYDGTNTGAAGQLGQQTGISGPDYGRTITFNPDGTVASTAEIYGDVWEVRQSHTYFANRGLRETSRDVVDVETGVVIESVRQERRLDAHGRLDALWLNGEQVLDLEYDTDGEGRLRAVNLTSGGSIQYFYDDADTRELTGQATQADGLLSSTSWAFDPRGQIAFEEFSGEGENLRQTFSYDDRGFLTGALNSAGVLQGAWDYDVDGLADELTDHHGTRRVQAVGAGEIVAGTVTYKLDRLGRISRRDGDRYVYGPDGKLEEAHVSGRIYAYEYDDEGRRVLKRDNGLVTTAYVGDGVLTAFGMIEPVRVNGKLIGIIDGGSFRGVHTDARGSLIVDEAGNYNFPNPYGVRTDRSALMEALDYVQKGYDSDLGIVRMGLRDYDPFIGRFRTPDPLFLREVDRCIDSPIECNLYSYARNNPLSFVDPTGTLSWKQIGAVAKVVGEVAVGFTPIGVAVDAVDLVKAIHSGDGAAIAVAAVGFIPGGDIVKAGYKAVKAAKAIGAVSHRVETVGGLFRVSKKVEVPCRCFAAGTLVRTNEGFTPIEKVASGMEVRSWEPTSNTTVLRPVRALFRADARPVLDVELQTEDGEDHTLQVTPDHPVWLEGIGWTQIRAVEVGEQVATDWGSVTVVGMRAAGQARVYNFEVSGTESYFAGPHGLLTHNCKVRGGTARHSGKHDILTLGRGTPEALSDVAEAVDGRVINRPDLVGAPRELWRHITREMRKADEIAQVMDDIPEKQVTGFGNGFWSRAEKLHIDNTPKLREKTVRFRRKEMGMEKP